MTTNQDLRVCDEEWLQFCQNDYGYEEGIAESHHKNSKDNEDNEDYKSLNNNNLFSNTKTDVLNKAPEPSNIYISTKTKIGYFDKEIDIQKLFWKIEVIPYQDLRKGVIKKQMKVATNDIDYIKTINSTLEKTTLNWEVHDLSKGKDKYIKKISIGISKKDLISYRTKKKEAFYNCFVLMFRVKTNEGFKEMHVKFFNTGKIEIPGIKNDYLMNIVLDEINTLFNDVLKQDIKIIYNTFNTVLINSNFNCGYYVNREKLVDILKNKYCLSTSYDPCSYPGIMSKFYYNKDIESIKKIDVAYIDQAHSKDKNVLSFMIFRTGSVLIVGKCNENILYKIYDFIKNILKNEYSKIYQKNISYIDNSKNNKMKKKIKRTYVKVTRS